MPKPTPSESAAASATEALPMPRLGEQIQVQVAQGLSLRNNENGALFEDGVPTLQTVTPTTLRRLVDGDLVRV